MTFLKYLGLYLILVKNVSGKGKTSETSSWCVEYGEHEQRCSEGYYTIFNAQCDELCTIDDGNLDDKPLYYEM